jgi:hypothetical protein
MITLTVRKPIVSVAMLMIAAGVLGACSSTGDATQPEATGSSPTPTLSSSPSTLPSSDAVLKTLDTDFDQKYRITMHLLDGYAQAPGGNPVVFGTDDGQRISAWTVANV